MLPGACARKRAFSADLSVFPDLARASPQAFPACRLRRQDNAGGTSKLPIAAPTEVLAISGLASRGTAQSQAGDCTLPGARTE
jgi:hypothetical protein